MMPPDHSRLAIDGRMLTHSEPTGVGSYARALFEALGTIGTVDIVSDRPDLAQEAPNRGPRAFRWLRAMRPGPRRARAIMRCDHSLLVSDDIFRIAQIHFDIYDRVLRLRVPGSLGLVHWTYPVPIAIEGWVNVYTVHDVIPLTSPELTEIDPARHRRLLEAILRHADGLITVSDSAAASIVNAVRVPTDFVHNCGQAVTAPVPIMRLPDDLTAQPYFLVLGSVAPRKNIERICEAFRRSAVPQRLIIAGPEGGAGGRLGEGNIVRLPYVSAELATALMAEAQALLMPSLAEGFGLPLIEAMALGTPVITSRGGATAEVAGEAALLVDPYDTESIAAAIRSIADEPAIARKLAAQGYVNAQRFTPATFARRLETAYLSCLGLGYRRE